MRHALYFCFAIFLAMSCSEEEVSPKRSTNASPKKEPKTTPSEQDPVPGITGLTRFKISDLSIPPEGLPDAKRFYSDGSLRASTCYNPYGITAVTRDGQSMIRYYVNPTAAPEYLLESLYPYHHRAEFSRYPWRISHPLGTEEWLGFSYTFPTEKEGFTPNMTPVNIYQNHAGSVEGQESNPPALKLEIAYPGQLKGSDPRFSTPLGGEIMIVNKILDYRYVAQGARVAPGARIDIIIQIVYGLESKGLFNVWVNGKLQTFPGSSELPAGNKGTTVWPENPVGGNWKLGLYHHQLRFENLVEQNKTAGHSQMVMYMTDWNDIVRNPSDWDYMNQNAYEAVSTAGY